MKRLTLHAKYFSWMRSILFDPGFADLLRRMNLEP